MLQSPTFVLLFATIAASLYAWQNPDSYRKWMMNPYQVQRDNQYYRFITSGFIHGDWMHLIFNMIALYFFGRNLEIELYRISPEYYQIYYYALYLLALVVSDIPTFWKHRTHPSYNSLGASGAIAAIIFACIILRPLGEIYLFYFIELKAFIFGIAYLIYSYTFSKRSIGGINHDAHFYGAVFGIVYIIIIYPEAVSLFFEQIKTWSLF